MLAAMTQRAQDQDLELATIRRSQPDLSRLRQENAQLRSQAEDLQAKLEEAKRDALRDRDFYETALEERFNQLEALEAECDDLRRTPAPSLEAPLIVSAAVEKERADWRKRWDTREKELAAKLDEYQDTLSQNETSIKDIQAMLEKKTEENYTLKQKIDVQRVELEKLRKRVETLEDQVLQREGQLKMS